MNKFAKQFLPLLILLTVLLGACTNPFFTALLKDKGKPGGGFAPQTNSSTANDAATLGFVGTSAVSSDTGVAAAAIEGGNIVITSVAEGNAVITVSGSGYTDATIEVTVGADGTVTIGTITPGTFVPVTGITGVPASGTAGEALTLNGTIEPAAAKRTIEWTVKTDVATGASISGNTLTTTGPGTVVVTAEIANGLAVGTAYTEDFSISISFPFTTPAQYREMKQAASANVTITGGSAYYYETSSSSEFRGVFIEGRSVTLSPFTIAKYETTYELWYEVKQWATDTARGTDVYTFANAGREGHDGATGGAAPTEAAKREPVTWINWRDAVVWCNAYSEMSGKEAVYYTDTTYGTVLRTSTNTEGTDTDADKAVMKPGAKGYRLPTEAEWEYAARGGGTLSTNKWAGTNTETDLVNYAWYMPNAYDVGGGHADYGTHEVGGKEANGLGLHDMSGNVWEWCWDWYEDLLAAVPVTDPAGPASGAWRMFRGGSWGNSASTCAVSVRFSYFPIYGSDFRGFRVACP
jgi:formylglycine-generating enzyme required for sulfatase activity